MAQPATLVVEPARVGREHEPPDLGDLPYRSLIPDAPPAVDAQPRALRWLVRALVLGIAIAAPVLAFGGEKEVALDVEGKVRNVRTYAASPEEVLERARVPVGRKDLVRPSRTLAGGETVTYRRAKPIEVVVDDQPREVVAHGLTVREVLADLGMRPGAKDHVTPLLSAPVSPGMELRVRNAVHAKVRADGRLRDVLSSGETVTELLGHAGIGVGESDYVIPSPRTKPTDGMWIRVVRVRRIVSERQVRVPFQHLTRRDPSLVSGVRKVVQQGAEGLKVRRIRFVLEDGVRVSSAVLSETVLRAPRNHIVRVGTKEPEYGGGGHTQQGIASWYRADGLVGAHPSLPMGTVVRVTNVDTGKSVNVRIADRGPFVDGRVIDLSSDAYRRVASLGGGTFKARVEW